MNNRILILLLTISIACSGDKTTELPGNEIEVRFSSDQTTEILNSNMSLHVFGHDRYLADAAATLITTQELRIEDLPFVAKIALPDNPGKLIDPPITNEASAEYYVSFRWDSDNNGDVCAGDYFIDFEKKWPGVELQSPSIQEIYLLLLPSTNTCD